MSTILFSTLMGEPLAMLGLSTPAVPQRQCIFVPHPQIASQTLRSRAGEIVFPDRPTEYPCSYARRRDGTVIEFENQIGWQFVVHIGVDNEGIWWASKGAERLTGHVTSPFGDATVH